MIEVDAGGSASGGYASMSEFLWFGLEGGGVAGGLLVEGLLGDGYRLRLGRVDVERGV